MAGNQKFRSEEARKNYEKNEKKRVQAQRRRERQAKNTRQTDAAKAWLKQHPGKAAAVAAAVVAVIVAVILTVGAVNDPLKGRQENWLILDVASGSKPVYRHLADYDIPAGYVRDDYSLYSDGVQQDFFCVAEDESSVVQDVYVTGAKGVVAADYPAIVLSYGLHKEAGEPRRLTIGGQACTALYLVSDESEYYGEGNAIAHMSFYFDAGSACVSATLRSGTVPADQVPDEAAMLAEAEKLLAGLTIMK